MSGGAYFQHNVPLRLQNLKRVNLPKDSPSAKVQNFLPFCKLFREKVSIFCAFIFSYFSMGSPLVSPLVSPATEDSPLRAPFYRPFPPILGSPEPFLQSRHSFILFTANKYIVPKTKIRPKDTNFTLKKQIFEPFFTFESKKSYIIKNTRWGLSLFCTQKVFRRFLPQKFAIIK